MRTLVHTGSLNSSMCRFWHYTVVYTCGEILYVALRLLRAEVNRTFKPHVRRRKIDLPSLTRLRPLHSHPFQTTSSTAQKRMAGPS